MESPRGNSPRTRGNGRGVQYDGSHPWEFKEDHHQRLVVREVRRQVIPPPTVGCSRTWKGTGGSSMEWERKEDLQERWVVLARRGVVVRGVGRQRSGGLSLKCERKDDLHQRWVGGWVVRATTDGRGVEYDGSQYDIRAGVGSVGTQDGVET